MRGLPVRRDHALLAGLRILDADDRPSQHGYTDQSQALATQLHVDLSQSPDFAGAQCIEVDPQQLFDADQTHTVALRTMCSMCPYQRRCLSLGMRMRASGWWGGQWLEDGHTATHPSQRAEERRIAARKRASAYVAARVRERASLARLRAATEAAALRRAQERDRTYVQQLAEQAQARLDRDRRKHR